MKWWDWLTATPQDLRDLGLDPKSRIHEVGHPRALSQRWACSVGCWELMPASTIRRRTKASRTSYDQFKHRWKVRAAKSVGGALSAVNLAEICYNSYSTLVDEISPGLTAFTLSKDKEFQKEAKLLPVEILLYSRAIDLVLEREGLEFEDFQELSDKDRVYHWKLAHAQDPELVLPVEVRKQYSGEHVVR